MKTEAVPGSDMDPDSRVQLAEIRGDIKLILAGQERTSADIHAIRSTLDRHDRRLLVLENARATSEGERKGLSTAGRIAWACVGVIPGGAIVAAIIKVFGA